MLRALLVPVAMSWAALSCDSVGEEHANPRKQETSVSVLRSIEPQPSAATKAMVESLFRRSDLIEFRFTPLKQIEPRGYKPEVDGMRYSYSFRCGDHCDLFAQNLMRRLSTLRQAEGDCPWITAAVIFRDEGSNSTLARFLVDSTGHCLVLNEKVYILGASESLAYLFDAFDSVFQ